MKKKALIKGAIIVLIASIIIRILGFLFRIYIAKKLGAQGMGVYQLIISLYMMVATFATSGITFSVSRMIAENFAIKKYNSPKTILKISTWWTIIISTSLTIILLVFANQIGTIILREPKTIESIYLMAPGIPFMAVAACLKGYFFAIRKANHPSNAGIIEQVIKMIAIMSLIGFFLNDGTSKACAIVSLGMTIGEVASAIYLATFYYLVKNKLKFKFRKNNKKHQKFKPIFKNMLQISVPIQLSSTFNAALRLVESVLIIECFKIFTQGNSELATSTYGIVRGMALPLILFPTSFLQAITTVLVPELSGANASKNKRTVRLACEKALQMTIFLGLYATSIFLVFSNQIATLFYSNTEVGPMMKMLSGLCPFLYVQIMCIGILNAIGEQIAAMKYNIIDAIVRIVLIGFLVPKGGFAAFILVMYIANIFTFLLFVYKLFQAAALPIHLNKLIVKPTIAITISAMLGANIEPIFNHNFSKFVSISISSTITAISFLILLICFNCASISWFYFKTKPKNKLLKFKL